MFCDYELLVFDIDIRFSRNQLGYTFGRKYHHETAENNYASGNVGTQPIAKDTAGDWCLVSRALLWSDGRGTRSPSSNRM